MSTRPREDCNPPENTAKANKKKLAAECAKLLGAFFVNPAEDQNAVG
jgi:hypothetical protein